MTLTQINSFLDTTVFTVANHQFSIAELLLIPIIVIAGIWLTRKIAAIAAFAFLSGAVAIGIGFGAQNKIVISFPQRDVHIDGEVKITRA